MVIRYKSIMTIYDYYLSGYLNTTSGYQEVTFSKTEERVAFALGALRGRSERSLETKAEVERDVALYLTAPPIGKDAASV